MEIWPSVFQSEDIRNSLFNITNLELTRLGGGFKYFLCSPLFGEDSQFDEHIFQMGWFNHQLGLFFTTSGKKSDLTPLACFESLP